MAIQTPFSLRIFVADGDPDGLRTVEKSNWIGKALVGLFHLLPEHGSQFDSWAQRQWSYRLEGCERRNAEGIAGGGSCAVDLLLF